MPSRRGCMPVTTATGVGSGGTVFWPAPETNGRDEQKQEPAFVAGIHIDLTAHGVSPQTGAKSPVPDRCRHLRRGWHRPGRIRRNRPVSFLPGGTPTPVIANFYAQHPVPGMLGTEPAFFP